MARFEEAREDLMRDATALVVRGEWRAPESEQVVVIGRKRDGSLSVYFGDDPCYHFDTHGQLRRAFAGGTLYRTQGTTLARLERVRTDRETTLQRTDLSEADCRGFLDEVKRRCGSCIAQIEAGELRLNRFIAPGDDVDAKELVDAVRRAAMTGGLADPIAARR